MFNLKLWLTPLLFLVAGGVLLVMGTTYLHDRILPTYERAAQHAAIGIKGQIQIDSAQAVNHAASLTGAPGVRAALDGDTAAAKELLIKVEKDQRAPMFGLVADATGAVVVSAGDNPFGEAIQGLPEFAEALTGVVRDGYGQLGGKHLHLAAAPIIKKGAPAGAVVLGYELNGDYAKKLGAVIGLPIAMVEKDGTQIGDGIPGLKPEDAQRALGGGVFGKLVLDLPVEAPLPVLVPEAKRFQAAAVSTLGPRAPKLILTVDRTDGMQTLALAQVWVVGVALLLAIIMVLIVLSIQRSISKPMDVIMDHLSAFAQGSAVGILPEAALRGPFMRLGKQINMILQAPPPGAAPRSGVSPVMPGLDGPSGAFPAPGLGEDLSAGFPAAPVTGDRPISGEFPLGGPAMGGPPSLPPDSAEDANFAPVSQAPVSDQLKDSGIAGLFDEGGDDPLAAFRVGGGAGGPPPPPTEPPSFAPPSTPPMPAGAAALPGMGGLPGAGAPPPTPPMAATPPPTPPMAATPPPTPPPGAAGGDYNPDATVMFQVPQELIQESAQHSATGRAVGGPPSMPSGPPVEDRTVVAQVPSELLSAAAPQQNVSADEDAHYRDVYQDFIRMRQRCGEDTDQLTYDRFVAKLMKNRQQIIDKYNSRSVRFQVYEKQGKAALRAVPVRD
jgi:hypothetical protein